MTSNKEKITTASLDERSGQMARAMLLLRRMQDKNTADFITSLGSLSMQQLAVLNIVGDNEPCTMSEIARKASLSLSSITILIDKLFKAKLVKRLRSDEDRRIVLATLTAEGKKIYQIQIEHTHAVIRRIFSVLSPTEQDQLIRIFQKITLSLL